jgi:hydroxymethylpyrimidine/phosphomethylpyrimidine kinase
MDAAFVRAAGGHAAGIVTCRTRQSPRGVYGIRSVPAKEIEADLALLLRDLPVAAIKVGLFATPSTARVLAEGAQSAGIPLVVDPVLESTSGFRFAGKGAIEALRNWLVPAAALVTPNRAEAARLSGIRIDAPSEAAEAARRLLEWGPRAVLVKGIAWRGRRIDVLVDRSRHPRYFGSKDIPGADPHGTGCALASAIAARLAAKDPLDVAVAKARGLVLASIRRRFLPAPRGLEFLSPTPRAPRR